MSDRDHLFAWTLAGAFTFALLGSLFGALAGGLSWRRGYASGGFLGVRVADAVARVLEGELTSFWRGAIIGAVDGAFFLGVIGTLIGLWAGYREEDPSEWLLPAVAFLAILMLGAVSFGSLAYTWTRLGVKSLPAVFGCGIGGALLGAWWGAEMILPGAVVGIFVGTIINLALEK